MGWLDYYRLLEKYNGNIMAATAAELSDAAKANPNDPPSARSIAEEEWRLREAALAEKKWCDAGY